MARQKRPGAGPSSRITRRQVLLAAYRHYELGETQAFIADEMKISPSYLAKLLRQAKERGWIRVFIDVDREIELAAAIKAKYPHLKHVEVVPTGASAPETAKSLATAMAGWFNDLLDEDEEREQPLIERVAIGGAWTHRLMVDQVVSRPNRISVGPTTLTPFRGRVDRWTASTVATQLAERLGALTPGDAAPSGGQRKGYFYNLSVDPPDGPLSALRSWYAALEKRPDYGEMLSFWQSCDVAFLSVAGLESLYEDVTERLKALDTSLEKIKAKGAVAVLANQFIDMDGRVVLLSEGVRGYELAFPLEFLQTPKRSGLDAPSTTFVLDVRGPSITHVVPNIPTITHLFTDSASATRLLNPS